MNVTDKTCTTCLVTQPIKEFYNRKASIDGKSYRCRTCDYAARNAYHKKHYEKVRVKSRDNQRKSRYGLTPEDFQCLWFSQAACCAICHTPLDDSFGRHHNRNKVVVDHNHKTGNVRGLLCTMCNKGLGLFKDNVEYLERAGDYIKNADIH